MVGEGEGDIEKNQTKQKSPEDKLRGFLKNRFAAVI
jgi:hypothetical protein